MVLNLVWIWLASQSFNVLENLGKMHDLNSTSNAQLGLFYVYNILFKNINSYFNDVAIERGAEDSLSSSR